MEDNSKLKAWVAARQVGKSFAAALRAVLKCLEQKTTWIFLSKGERQSKLLMEKVAEHIRAIGAVAESVESTFMEGTLVKQLEVRFANGSVIYGLPANPDTARGYSGNITLDEFAFHADADKIYQALFPTITRGYGLEVISTPNGTQGKFYELAKAAGLTVEEGKPGDATAPAPERSRNLRWSGHYVNIYDAVQQGFKVDLDLLREGCEDEMTWLQEFCCQFISTAENFLPPELIASCLSAQASADGQVRSDRADSEFYLGIDIGRKRDRTVFWVDEVMQLPAAPAEAVAKVFSAANAFSEAMKPEKRRLAVTRMVRILDRVPFGEQMAVARELLSSLRAEGGYRIRRACIDASGVGAPLAEELGHEFGYRIEPVVFTMQVKEDMAYRVKRRMEDRLDLLPDMREVVRAFSAVKRFVTPSGNIRFDAERTDAGHADEFWAKALADLAADSGAPLTSEHRIGARCASALAAAY